MGNFVQVVNNNSKRSPYNKMRLIQIPKKSGGVRLICVPSRTEKGNSRSWLFYLNKIQLEVCDKDIVHGLVRGKSPVTNALAHKGFRYTLSFDLKDFFDTVTIDMVKDIKDANGDIIFDDKLIKDTFLPNPSNVNEVHCYQGLPTSPIVANLAAVKLDKEIKECVHNLGYITYTRYADDLSFSFDDRDLYEDLKHYIPKIVAQNNFKINDKKTRLQDGKFFNRVITGVVVRQYDIKATRATRRKLRAALHKPEYKKSVGGLKEWVKLKTPKKVAGGDDFTFDAGELTNLSESHNDWAKDEI